MKNSFEAFWARNGVESENDQIKKVVETIYNILNSDIFTTLEEDDANQTIIDREEFSELLQLITQVLKKYIDVENIDFIQTTSIIQARVQKLITDAINEFVKKQDNNENSQIDEKSIKKQIEEALDKFIQENTHQKDKHEQKPSDDVYSKLFEKIKSTNVKNDVVKVLTQVEASKTFGEFKKKLVIGDIEFARRIIDRVKIFSINNAVNKVSLRQISRVKIFDNKKERSKKDITQPKNIFQITNQRIRIFNKKLQKNILGVFEKTLVKFHNIPNVVKKHFAGIFGKIKNMFVGVVSIILLPVKLLFAPIKKIFVGLKNSIMHPLKTLKKLVGGNILTKLIGNVMKNPAAAYGFGFFVGFLMDFLKLKVWGFIQHIFVKPTMAAFRWITDFINPKKHSIAQLLIDTFNIIKLGIGLIFKIFKPVDGVDFLAGILINIAKLAGAPLSVDFANALIHNIPKILEYASLYFSPTGKFLNGVSPLLLPLMYFTKAAAKAIASIFVSDEEKKEVSLNEKIKSSLEKSDQLRSNIEAKIRNFNLSTDPDKHINEDERSRIMNNVESIENEGALLNKLKNWYEELRDEDTDESLNPNILESFLNEVDEKNPLFNTDQLRTILRQLSLMAGNDFGQLPRVTQLDILKKFLEIRTTRLNRAINELDQQTAQTLRTTTDSFKDQLTIDVFEMDRGKIETDVTYGSRSIRNWFAAKTDSVTLENVNDVADKIVDETIHMDKPWYVQDLENQIKEYGLDESKAYVYKDGKKKINFEDKQVRDVYRSIVIKHLRERVDQHTTPELQQERIERVEKMVPQVLIPGISSEQDLPEITTQTKISETIRVTNKSNREKTSELVDIIQQAKDIDDSNKEQLIKDIISLLGYDATTDTVIINNTEPEIKDTQLGVSKVIR